MKQQEQTSQVQSVIYKHLQVTFSPGLPAWPTITSRSLNSYIYQASSATFFWEEEGGRMSLTISSTGRRTTFTLLVWWNCQLWLLPTNNVLLNKLPPELRGRNLVSKHRVSIRIGAQTCEKHVCNVYIFRLSFHFAYQRWWLGRFVSNTSPPCTHPPEHNTTFPTNNAPPLLNKLQLRSENFVPSFVQQNLGQFSMDKLCVPTELPFLYPTLAGWVFPNLFFCRSLLFWVGWVGEGGGGSSCWELTPQNFLFFFFLLEVTFLPLRLNFCREPPKKSVLRGGQNRIGLKAKKNSNLWWLSLSSGVTKPWQKLFF